MTASGERAYTRRDCALSLSLRLSFSLFSFSREENTDLIALARAAGKTRGKSTTGGTNILGVLTSQGGGNVSEEGGEGVRVRPCALVRARASAPHK